VRRLKSKRKRWWDLYSTFEGPTAKIQVFCSSTPGVVYKYVKTTHTEETLSFLWNAKLRINAFGLSRFLNASLPGGSYCMRDMRFLFADIVRAYHKTLWRIVAEAQVASSFCTGPPNMKNCGFLPKLTASCALDVGHRQNNSVCPGRVYVSLLHTAKSGRLSPP